MIIFNIDLVRGTIFEVSTWDWSLSLIERDFKS